MNSFFSIRDAIVTRYGAKALLCVVRGSEIWVPYSQLDLQARADPQAHYPIGYHGAIKVSEWWLGVSKNWHLVTSAPSDEPKAEPDPLVTITADDLPNASALRRKLAMKYHPDRVGGNTEMMRDINQLWQEMVNDLRGNNR
jgi:hypothetical protein